MCPVSCSRFQNALTEGWICLPRGPHLLLAAPIQLNQGVIRGCLSSIAGLETTDPFYRERSDIFLGGKIKAQNTSSPSIPREFEGKRGDREVEKIFGVLERVSELRDCGLPQLVERASGGEAAKLVGALQVELPAVGAFKIGVQVSLSMVDRVQRQAETGEVEETLAASRLTWPSSLFVRDLPLREARAREWTNFQNEARARVARLEARDREQEEAIRRRWASYC